MKFIYILIFIVLIGCSTDSLEKVKISWLRSYILINKHPATDQDRITEFYVFEVSNFTSKEVKFYLLDRFGKSSFNIICLNRDSMKYIPLHFYGGSDDSKYSLDSNIITLKPKAKIYLNFNRSEFVFDSISYFDQIKYIVSNGFVAYTPSQNSSNGGIIKENLIANKTDNYLFKICDHYDVMADELKLCE